MFQFIGLPRVDGILSSRAWVPDFPDSTMNGNLPASAGNTGSVLGAGRFHMLRGNSAHAPQPPIPHAVDAKALHLKPVLCKKEPPWWEARAQQKKKKKRVAALTATRGCSAQQQRTSTTKIKSKFFKKREEEPGFLDSEWLLAGWGEPRGGVLSGRISEILKCWYACQVLGCWGSRSWCHPKRHSLTSPPLPSWGVRS